jgi:hypothetical protein
MPKHVTFNIILYFILKQVVFDCKNKNNPTTYVHDSGMSQIRLSG